MNEERVREQTAFVGVRLAVYLIKEHEEMYILVLHGRDFNGYIYVTLTIQMGRSNRTAYESSMATNPYVCSFLSQPGPLLW